MNIIDKLPMKFIKWALAKKIHLTLEPECINLNTGMKSDLRIHFEHGRYIARMRYDEVRVLSTFWDLYLALKGCLHGREYMSNNMSEIVFNGFGDIEDDVFE